MPGRSQWPMSLVYYSFVIQSINNHLKAVGSLAINKYLPKHVLIDINGNIRVEQYESAVHETVGVIINATIHALYNIINTMLLFIIFIITIFEVTLKTTIYKMIEELR